MNEARDRLHQSDAEIVERLERFGYRVAIRDIAFTTESVDDFREARLRWIHAGHVRIDEPGLLILEKAQPQHGQPTRDMLIVSLGASRVVMGVHVPPGSPPLPAGSSQCRFAPTMQWAPPMAVQSKPAAAPPKRRPLWR